MNKYKITLIVEADDLADSVSNLEDVLQDNGVRLMSSAVEILDNRSKGVSFKQQPLSVNEADFIKERNS
jgi:hypothetical protein